MGDNGKISDVDMRSPDFGQFVGISPIMNDIYQKIQNIAATTVPVFITGESGTGKEICAQAIHKNSSRSNKPFVALNCAALSQTLVDSALFGHVKGAYTGAIKDRAGAIALACGGTLFLDEVCDMPLDIQAKLLRFTQDQQYQKLGSDKFEKADVRLICATNSDVESKIEENNFREDLYYRLNSFPIHMPALRDRGGDIINLAYFFLSKYARENNKHPREFSDNAKELLKSYPWPGNIREMQNVIRQIIAQHNHPVINISMLPDPVKKAPFQNQNKTDMGLQHLRMPLWRIEKQAIENTIRLCSGNIPKAAAILDISPSTIYRKKKAWEEKEH